jgi:hypothetical protein
LVKLGWLADIDPAGDGDHRQYGSKADKTKHAGKQQTNKDRDRPRAWRSQEDSDDLFQAVVSPTVMSGVEIEICRKKDALSTLRQRFREFPQCEQISRTTRCRMGGGHSRFPYSS